MIVNRAVERAQSQVESQNFEIRKNVLKYDEVMNSQRENIYRWRKSILEDTAGEDLIGVCSANEFLTRVNLMRGFDFPKYDTPVAIGRRVVVVGAGNVAMDCCRTALRLGCERVICLYRRTRDEAPARLEGVQRRVEDLLSAVRHEARRGDRSWDEYDFDTDPLYRAFLPLVPLGNRAEDYAVILSSIERRVGIVDQVGLAPGEGAGTR